MKLDQAIKYFYSLIDDQGIIQFSRGYQKDYSYGYAIEDQARALILALKLKDQKLADHFYQIIKRSYAGAGVKMLWDRNGNYQEKIDVGGEASAETVWALGRYYNSTHAQESQIMARKLLRQIEASPHPRAWAYGILGSVLLKEKETTILLADKLVELFEKNSTPDRPWFEKKLTYANALLPWALLHNNRVIAEESLQFLFKKTIKDGVPFLENQQPIDFAYLVLALLDFYQVTKEKKYLEKAKFYFSWFNGNNLQKVSMIRTDGGCYDGLFENGVNPNSGAESNICYLLAALSIKTLTSFS